MRKPKREKTRRFIMRRGNQMVYYRLTSHNKKNKVYKLKKINKIK